MYKVNAKPIVWTIRYSSSDSTEYLSDCGDYSVTIYPRGNLYGKCYLSHGHNSCVLIGAFECKEAAFLCAQEDKRKRALEKLEIEGVFWRSRETAPTNTRVWVLFRSDLETICPDRPDIQMWNGVQCSAILVPEFGGNWSLCTPVRDGLFAAEWVAAWRPLPDSEIEQTTGTKS